MRPVTQANCHDLPGLGGEFIQSLTAVIDEIVIGFEDAIGEPIIAEELPYVLHRDMAMWVKGQLLEHLTSVESIVRDGKELSRPGALRKTNISFSPASIMTSRIRLSG